MRAISKNCRNCHLINASSNCSRKRNFLHGSLISVGVFQHMVFFEALTSASKGFNKNARLCFLIPVNSFILRSKKLQYHAILLSQIFDSTKWPTVLVHKLKGKPCNFEEYVCVIYILLFVKHLSKHAFHNERFQTLFINKLARS